MSTESQLARAEAAELLSRSYELGCRIALTFCEQVSAGMVPERILPDDAAKLRQRLRQILGEA